MKRLFKKLLPVLAGMMVFSAVPAYAQTSSEAKAVYDELEAKSQTMADGNMYIQLNMNMTDGTDSLGLTYASNTLYKNMLQPENLEMLSQNIVWLEDIELPFVTWYKDGYSYTDMMGEKVKSSTDMTKAMNNVLAYSKTFGSSSELMSSLTLRTEGDKRILSYKMDDTKLNTYVQQVLAQTGLDSMMQGIQIKARNVSGAYTLTPDNFYSSATVNMLIDLTYEGETLSIYVNGHIDLLNQGQPVELELPSPVGYTDAAEIYN